MVWLLVYLDSMYELDTLLLLQKNDEREGNIHYFGVCYCCDEAY